MINLRSAGRTETAHCWTEVYTRDKNNVDPFYQDVFGFTARQTDDGTGSDLVARAVDGTGVASRAHLGDHFPTELHGHVLAFFAVDDCDQSTEKLLTLGGKVTVAPRDSRHGRFSITTDDQGTRFAMVDLHTRLANPKN